MAVVFHPCPVSLRLGENIWLPALAVLDVARTIPSADVFAVVATVSVRTVPFVVTPAASPTTPPLSYSSRVVVPLVIVVVPIVIPLLPAGVAHVPSPRQNVEDDALVPEFRLLTDRLPVTPVDNGSPVHEVNVPEVGVPRIGVTSVGDVAKTAEPVPVSSVNAAIKFAEDGVARNVATPVPKPDTPVEIGSPVHEVKTPAEGVPMLGVTRVGEADVKVLTCAVVILTLAAL